MRTPEFLLFPRHVFGDGCMVIPPKGYSTLRSNAYCIMHLLIKMETRKKDPSEVRFFFLVSILLLNAFKSFLSVPVCLMTFGDSNDVSKP